MGRTTVQIKTLAELYDSVNKLRQAFPSAFANSVYRQMNYILNESKRICPVNTGNLRRSGWVADPEISTNSIIARMGYSAKYAYWVHELVENYHHPPTRAKFLEIPIRRYAPATLKNIIIDVYRRVGLSQ